ncbi:TRAP transporter large permease subunit [Siculibacillus lacustris]|uniref:TRAP transporter large permease subunit n=1 Tax=Siculibacillus lacustris TaxID=1549641 RepID=A0A4Q9VVA2_9HYPH|nr:TRAP transporter large permease subunit [Siculibacillus lacustris]TBW40059.1 TRAP transporter large permease subunit [Siculibacillus lacustris]
MDIAETPTLVHTGAFAKFDRRLGRCVEAVAAVMVVAEAILLGWATTARYAFGAPLTWSDELATVLFVWLSMLGSVVALRRDGHMRLTAFIRGLSPVWRARVDALGLMLVCAVLSAMIMPTWEHVESRIISPTPVLEISEAWREGALIVGIALMLMTAIDKLIQNCTVAQIVGALAATAAAAFALHSAAPFLDGIGNYNLILFFLVLVAFCMVIGMPIALSFILATAAYLQFSTTIPVSIVPGRISEGMSHMVLLAVPMFVLLGALIEIAGLARAMISFLISLIGHLRGGLQYVLLGAMYLVSGISGAKAADMAAIAPALFPEMKKRGARDGDLVSLLNASAVMSETIPPSIVLITVGSVTGVSIAALFTGGLLPAVVGMACLAFVVWFQTRNEDMSKAERHGFGARLKLFAYAIPGLGLPIVIRTAVVEGVATATEVATIGVVYTILVGMLFYRCFDWRKVYGILVDTASLSGAILLVVGAATAMAWALTQSGFSQQLVTLMTAVPGGKVGFLLVSAFAFVVLGSVLEGVPAIVLFGPLLFPIARLMGVNEVHYAIIAVFSMGLGLFTPPFGVGFYLSCAIGRASPDDVIHNVWPHLAAMVVALLLIVFFPWISTGFL